MIDSMVFHLMNYAMLIKTFRQSLIILCFSLPTVANGCFVATFVNTSFQFGLAKCVLTWKKAKFKQGLCLRLLILAYEKGKLSFFSAALPSILFSQLFILTMWNWTLLETILECLKGCQHHVWHGWELGPWWSKLTLHHLLHKHL